MKEQFIKDLEFIRWNVEHKEQVNVLQVVDIIMKRYQDGSTIPDIVDPGQENICDGCQ